MTILIQPQSGVLDISLFERYITTPIPSVPLPLLEWAVRLACIEFCRRTLIWTETLPDGLTLADQESYELDRPDDSTVIKLVSLQLGDQPVGIVTLTSGLAKLRDVSLQSGQEAFLDTESQLHFVPVPTEGNTTFRVDASLAPTEEGTVLPGLLAEYKETISKGALARLYDLPDCTWSDDAKAATKQMEFDARISKTALRVNRGMSSAKIRAAASAPSKWY